MRGWGGKKYLRYILWDPDITKHIGGCRYRKNVLGVIDLLETSWGNMISQKHFFVVFWGVQYIVETICGGKIRRPILGVINIILVAVDIVEKYWVLHIS